MPTFQKTHQFADLEPTLGKDYPLSTLIAPKKIS